jgi:hypothetical protein
MPAAILCFGFLWVGIRRCQVNGIGVIELCAACKKGFSVKKAVMLRAQQ